MKEVMFSPASVFREQDYMKSFQVIFVITCRLMDYCDGKIPFSSDLIYSVAYVSYAVE